jgi:hypothetical protein
LRLGGDELFGILRTLALVVAVLVATAAISLQVKGTEQYIGRVLWAEHSPLDFAFSFSVDLP